MKLLNKIFISFLLAFILFFNINNVFASDEVAFEGNVEEGAWDCIINLPEYTSGNYYLYVTKYYSEYKVFFVEKVFNYNCYFLKEDFTVSKYGILEECNHLYFNQAVNLNVYTVSADGSDCIKDYNNVTEEEFICINPYDHSYSSTYIYTDNTYTTLFFPLPVTEVTIPSLEAVEQIPGIMTTILKITLPIGLIVLGIGLVILVVKSVICRHL